MDDGNSQASALSNVASWPKRLKDYFEDLQGEMRRVTWPTKKQVYATTAVVILTVFAFALYFWLIDLLLGRGITRLFETLSSK